MEIRAVRYSDILGSEEAKELLREYATECSIPELGTTNPQIGMYAAMENSGLMRSFGAFKDDCLVGFATVLVYVLPHYGRKICTVESIFVAREHRAELGKNLMVAVESHASENGCAGVLYSAPRGSRFERLLGSLKSYRQTNSVFLRSF